MVVEKEPLIYSPSSLFVIGCSPHGVEGVDSLILSNNVRLFLNKVSGVTNSLALCRGETLLECRRRRLDGKATKGTKSQTRNH